MTATVPVCKYKVMFGSRRLRGGFFRIPPIPAIRDAILYICLHYAERHEIELWSLVIMSNHIHWIGLDHAGRYPDFIRDVHMRIAEVINDHHGLSGRFWSGDRPRTPRLEGTILETLLYVATNPVKDGLVDVSTNWPGVVFTPENAGKRITVTCPPYLQKKYKSFPPTIEYVVPIPYIYGDMRIAEVRRDFARRRRAREAALIAVRKHPAMGAKRALAVGPDERPANEPAAKPFRCFHASAELEEACRTDLHSFRRRYAGTRQQFNKGRRNVRWPYGTYARVRWHRCPCEHDP